MDIETKDINNDGFEDLLLVGAIYNTEVQTPSLDSGLGLVLISNQSNGYVADPKLSTEFYMNGNAKSIELIKDNNNNELAIVGFNNDSLSVYKVKNP